MSRNAENLVWEALSNSTRRKILDLVRENPKTTGDICQRFKSLDRCTVMLHISVLERANLIVSKRKGKFRWNYLNDSPIKSACKRWVSKRS
jgi:DNA-binding transcriptional ArsR family regulator